MLDPAVLLYYNPNTLERDRMRRRRHPLRTFAPLAAAGLAFGLWACDGPTIRVDGEKGVPLSELDLEGPVPRAIALLGPDTVEITRGARLAVTMDGSDESQAAMRFTLKNGTLSVLREGSLFDRSDRAIVRIAMPDPERLILAGSGTIRSAHLAKEASVAVMGSGRAEVETIDADRLEIEIMGSGVFAGSGTARELDLSVAGSGATRLADLKVDRADVSVMGSGDSIFASDGTVNARIMGSGDVTVRGRANCTLKSMGSGSLRCENASRDGA